jgi:hypothetical protein
MKRFNFNSGDKVTLSDRKSHEYILIIRVYEKWFVGICHRGEILARSKDLDWIAFTNCVA